MSGQAEETAKKDFQTEQKEGIGVEYHRLAALPFCDVGALPGDSTALLCVPSIARRHTVAFLWP